MLIRTVLVGSLLAKSLVSNAGDISHEFHSPAFTGQGYSTHVLTIHQLEKQRKDEIKDAAVSKQKEEERAKKSTNVYKFQNNLESRIYAQLSKQISDSLFGEAASGDDTEWVESSTPFGDTVSWRRLNDTIYVNVTNSNGDVIMESTTPVGEFAF